MDDLYYRSWGSHAIADLGFDREAHERAHMLVRLIDGIFQHPFLGSRLALKGGAAINLFRRDPVRVPLDVDLDYVATRDRAAMAAEQPRFLEPLSEVVADLDMARAMVVQGEINFLWRTPLWPTRRRDSCSIAGDSARHVVVEDEHDTAAAKLATVIARSASRDLFDGRELLHHGRLDPRKLRLSFLVYGVLQHLDWRTASVARIATDPASVATLVPQLRRDLRPAPDEVAAWTRQLVGETRDAMVGLLTFEPHERAFLDRVYTAGELAPELLTRDPAQREIIRRHPGLVSKLNAIRHQLGLPNAGVVEEHATQRFRMQARWSEDEAPALPS